MKINELIPIILLLIIFLSYVILIINYQELKQIMFTSLVALILVFSVPLKIPKQSSKYSDNSLKEE